MALGWRGSVSPSPPELGGATCARLAIILPREQFPAFFHPSRHHRRSQRRLSHHLARLARCRRAWRAGKTGGWNQTTAPWTSQIHDQTPRPRRGSATFFKNVAGTPYRKLGQISNSECAIALYDAVPRAASHNLIKLSNYPISRPLGGEEKLFGVIANPGGHFRLTADTWFHPLPT